MSHNEIGAWRSGGVSAKLGREPNFQNPAKCRTRHAPPDAKPPRLTKSFIVNILSILPNKKSPYQSIAKIIK